jgi:hypothetical protein
VGVWSVRNFRGKGRHFSEKFGLEVGGIKIVAKISGVKNFAATTGQQEKIR